MAVPARSANQSNPGKRLQKAREISSIEEIILQLYQRGTPRATIARVLTDQLVDPGYHRNDLAKRHKRARSKLRQMEETQWFRDELFRRTVVKTDLAVPQIMEGIVSKAVRGDVPAAKFALEIGGRYDEKRDAPVAAITINFGAEIPRPENRNFRAEPLAEGVVTGEEWADED